MADLLINGLDAYATFGVRMGDGFLEAIGAPVPVKDYIENQSRTENGKRVITTNVKLASREVSLEFTIQGSSPQDYQAKKKAFLAEMYSGALTVKVPDDSADVYHLIYRGNSPTYAMSRNRCFARMVLKLEEPNPANRT